MFCFPSRRKGRKENPPESMDRQEGPQESPRQPDPEEFSMLGGTGKGRAGQSGRNTGKEAGDGHGCAQVDGKEPGSCRNAGAQPGKLNPSGIQPLGKDFGNVPREGMDQPQPPLRAGSSQDEEGACGGSSQNRDGARHGQNPGAEPREQIWEKLRGLGENMEKWEEKSTADLAARLAQLIVGTPACSYPAQPGILREPGIHQEPGIRQEPGINQEPGSGASQDTGNPVGIYCSLLGMLRSGGSAESREEDLDLDSDSEQPVVVACLRVSPRSRLLAENFPEVWARSRLDCGMLEEAELLDGDPVPFQEERPQPWHVERRMEELLPEYVKQGIVVEGTSSSNNPWILIPKKKGRGWRLSLQCSALNDATPVGPPERPDREAILAAISHRSCFFSVLDLSNACLAIPLDLRCWGRFAFTFRGRQFMFTRLPPTFHGTSSILHRRVAAMLAQLPPGAAPGVFHYYDDILITGKSRSQAERRTCEVLELIQSTGFKANPDKAQLVQSKVDFLGITIGADGCSIPKEKVREICADLDAPRPWNPTRLRSVLGKFNSFKNFIPDHYELALPLQRLAGPGGREQDWEWGQEQRRQLQRLRAALEDAPVLRFPVKSRPFLIRITVHAETAGAALLQENAGILHPVRYSSHKLSGQNLSPPDAWCTAAVQAVREFRTFTGPAPIILQDPNGNYLLQVSDVGGCWRPEEWTLLVAPKGPAPRESPRITIGLAPPLGQLPPDFPRANVWFLAVEQGTYRDTSVGFGLACLEGRCMTAVAGQSSVPEVELEALRELLEQHGSRSPLLLYCNRPGLAARLEQREQDGNPGGDTWRIVRRWLRAFPGTLRIREVGPASDPLERERIQDLSSSVVILPEITRSSWIMWEPSKYERQEALARCHRWHEGVEETVARMREVEFSGSDKNDAVTQWVQNCPTCRENNPAPSPDPDAPQRAQGPWSCLRISLSKALPGTPEGFQALLVAQDALSGWLDAFPLRQRSAPEVTQTLLREVFGRFGKVQTVVLAPAPGWMWDSLQEPPLRGFWSRLERSEPQAAAAGVFGVAQAAGQGWAEALPLILAATRSRWVKDGELQPLLCIPELPLEVCWEWPSVEQRPRGDDEENELSRLRGMRLRPRAWNQVEPVLWNAAAPPDTWLLGVRNWGVPDPGSRYARLACTIRWIQDWSAGSGIEIRQIRRQGALDLGAGYQEFGMGIPEIRVRDMRGPGSGRQGPGIRM